MFGVKIYSRMLTAVLVILACLCLAMPVFAEGEKVAKIEGGAEYESINAALEKAQDGDTVVLLQDTAENVEISGKKIILDLCGFTLTSKPEEGKEAETTFFSVTQEAVVTVKNGTLAGAAKDGKPVQVEHAVYVVGSTFTLDHATISGHSVATSGGGIYADKAVIEVLNGSVVTGNTANGTAPTSADTLKVGSGGGGIYACNSSAVTIDAGIISKNDAVKSGGGLLLNGSVLTAKNGSQINENKAHATEKNNGGGGIYSVNKSTIAIVDSQINKNISGARGGGIAVYNGNGFGNVEKPLDIQKSTIDGNIATGTNAWGGGICYESYVTSIEYVNIQNCSFIGNTSSANGPVSVMGSYKNASNFHITIQNSDFCNNTIETNAGGPLTISYSNHLTVKECTFKENQGGSCGMAEISNTNGFVFDDLEIENNEAQLSGALRLTTNGSGTISGSKFIGNKSVSADNDNSAGCVYQGTTTVVNYVGCTFSGNSSKAGAGAVLIRETGFDGASAVFEGSVITNNSGALVGGIYFDTWFNARLIVKADSNGNGAVYGNTTTGSGSGNDFYISKSAASTTSTTIDLMAASSMKDGEKTLENHSYYSGEDTYDRLTNAICKENPSSFYSVQYCPETNVVKNVSQNCAFNEKKYALLLDAVGEVEAEETADATHVLQLIAGENPGESKVIRQQATIRKDMEIQLNGRTIKPSAGTALVVEKNAHLILSGSGEVDTFGEGSAALAVNGTCSVTGAATIPSIRLGNGKSVAVTADAKINKVYLDASVLKSLNLSAADMSVVLFTPYEGADISGLLPSVEVQGINKLVTVGMDDDGNIAASCKKMVGVFVDGISGNDKRDGLTPTTPVKTFGEAKKILENNPDIGGIYVLNTVPVYDKPEWDLGGKWFKRYPTNVNSLISVGALAELTLKNIVVDGASDMVNADSAMVRVSRNGVLNITDGAELCNNSRDSSDPQRYLEHGGAVLSEGVVNMSGGSIHHNNADNGGGIFMYDEYAKLNLSGGVIENNTVNESMLSSYGPSGGGVCLGWGADMDMTGGLVSCNTARYGGGIAVGAAYDDPDSVLKMTGGIVKGNSAELHGGGIFVQTNCKAYISAGQIIGNVAAPGLIGHFAGGGIYVNGNYSSISEYNYGELHLTDALIYENTAGIKENNYGGGGIGGCESSHTLIYNTHGAAIYDNVGMDLALNRSAWGMVGDPRPVGDIAEYMLGGGAYNWTDKNGAQFDSNKLDAFGYFEAAKSNPTAEAIATAKQLGSVLITGNSTGGNGGGIGSNGTVIIGVEEDVVDLSVTKLWNDLDNEEQLTEMDGKYYLYPEEGAEIVHPESFRVWLLRDGERVSVVEFKAESGIDEDGKTYLAWPKTLDFNDLPVGDHEYAIEEEMPQDALYACVIGGTAEDGFVVTNHYNPTCSITFEGEKTITGREMSENDRFAFEIVEKVEGEEVFVAPAFSDGTGKISFPELTYQVPDVGEHEYIVRETGEEGKGIALDSKTYAVIVNVENNGDGTLSVSASENAFALNFVNIYSVEPTTASFPVKKVLEVPEGLTCDDITGKFTFTLSAEVGIPMPETTSCTNPDKDGGVVTFGEIEFTKPGEYKYTIMETGSADGVTNDKDAAKTVTVTVVDNGDGTLTATANSTTEAPLTFTNKYSVEPTTASFPVKKVLEVPEGLTCGDITGKFTFTLSAEAGIPMPETTSCTNPDKDGGVVTFGEIEFTKPGEYKYTITETGTAAGVTNDKDATKTVTVKVKDNGDGTLTAIASSTDDKPLTFTNTYGVKTTKASFPVKKVLEVPEGMEGPESWSYTIDVAAQNGAPAADTMTGAVTKAADTVTFGPFTYDKPGEYKYTITETGSVDGVTNDAESSKMVTVTVKDNGDGTLTATASSTADKPLTFTNTYGVKTTTASFPVKKVLEVPEGLTCGDITDKFTFTLSAEAGIPMPETTSCTNPDKDGGVVTFGEIEYTKPGEYKYTITETGSADGVTNDKDATKTVTVTVVDNGDGTLTATADSTTDKPLTFTNTYGVKPTAVAIHVSKVLTGRALNAGEFSFELKNAAGETLQTKANAADGSVVFDAISYAAPGAHAYTIHEVSGDLGGVTYDGGKIEVAVTVIDNGDGTLTATAVYGDKKQFENSYATNDKLVLNGIKNLVGREFRADEVFEVELLQNGTVIQRCMVGAVNGNKAAFSFDPITYTTAEVGTYQYTVREKAGSLKGITYDATQYTVDVTVSDDGKGDLIVDAVYTVNGKAAENIVFTNIYEATGELTLTAEKTVNGAEPAADQVFDFTLSDANGEIETVQNKLGEIEFTKLTYTLDDLGEHVYTVKENKTDKAGYAIDETVYTVKVNVTDNGDGTLKVEKRIMSNGKPAEGMTFDNKHSATLTISKKVEGCTTEETFPIKVWLFDAKGNELKGEYAYTGDVTGKLTSGEAVELGHDQRITIEKLPVGSRYKVEETRDPRFTTMVNSLMMNTAEGEIVEGGNTAAFVNRLITTMFKVRKEWQGGDGGTIILTLYANGEKLEDQPAYTQEGDTYYYSGLPMYDEDGDEIIYSAKEKYVDGFLTIYKNVEPYAEETKAIYNGGTIINKAITTIKVQKVWSGLAEGAEVPEITLILHCNGEVYDRKTPDPDEDGWYVYSNLPVFVNGERAVYSVTEEPMEGCSTIYTNNGEEGDCAYNGGVITNIVVPKTGDETPVELWMAGLLLSVAAIVLIGKKRTKA